MSDNAIRVGDLVCVVRHHCFDASSLGEIFTVSAIISVKIRCGYCGKRLSESLCADDFATNTVAPLSWLRRIPPLGELDEAERKIEEPIT